MTPDQFATHFFDAIERGDIDAVGACYAEDVVIWHNTDAVETSKTENLKTLAGLIRGYPQRRYEERRLSVFPGGFVQQHVLRGVRVDGARRELAACLVCQVSDGKITRLDEYFDAAQVALWSA
jgi:ketosteroid isomerase-like protein